MNKEYSMLFQKNGSESFCKDLQDNFGFVCTSFKTGDIESKELEHNDWFDSDGEDTYIPSTMRINSFSLTVDIVCSGENNESMKNLNALVDYLRGAVGGGLTQDGLFVYSSYLKRGWCGCYFLSMSDISLYVLGNYECLECSLKLKVCDPVHQVSVVESSGKYKLTKI
jgi:hypothetical protein